MKLHKKYTQQNKIASEIDRNGEREQKKPRKTTSISKTTILKVKDITNKGWEMVVVGYAPDNPAHKNKNNLS